MKPGVLIPEPADVFLFASLLHHLQYWVILDFEKYFPDIGKHVLLMLSVFSSNCPCEQHCSSYMLVKNMKSRTRTRLTDEYLVRCVQVATKRTKPDILKADKKQCHIPLLTEFVKQNYEILIM